jgi:hypothetical protein
LTSPQFATVFYSNVASLALLPGFAADNEFDVQGTAAGTLTTIYGFSNDTFNVGSTINSLNLLQGPLSVIGSGTDSLFINDQGATASTYYDLTSTMLTSALPDGREQRHFGTISYSGMESLALHGGSGDNVPYIQSTPAGLSLSVYSGTGNDVTYFIMPGIAGPVFVDPQSGANTTYFYDGPSNVDGRTYTITNTGIARTGGFSVTFPSTSPQSLALFTINDFVDTIYVQSVSFSQSWYLAPYGGSNQINVGDPAAGLNGIQGLVTVASEVQPFSNDTLTVNDQPATAAETYNLGLHGSSQSYELDRTGAAPIIYTGNTKNLVVNGGSGGNTFIVQNIPASTSLNLNGGSGVNRLQGPDIANTWKITGPNTGTLNSNVNFSAMQNLTGGAAADTFNFQSGSSLAGKIDGGAGINALDYSAYKGDILVDLLLHTAGLVSQGVFNVANVTGSQGNDLLVGDANANILAGGSGRNVIIGDGFGDKITGGGGFNLLIGGTTTYDNNLPALQALMQFWDDAAKTTLDSLVNPLKKGITVNGQFLVFNKTTVSIDNPGDSLMGGSGPNWFIVVGNDTINNGNGPGPNDRLLRIK